MFGSQDGNASCPGIFTARSQRGSFECRTRLKFRFRRQLRSVLLFSAFPQPTEAVERIRRQRSEYPVPDCAVPLLAAPLSYRPPERRTSHSCGLHCCKLRAKSSNGRYRREGPKKTTSTRVVHNAPAIGLEKCLLPAG